MTAGTGAFAEIFGQPAEATYHAPGRVNLIGEYTDLNESFVLPFATPQGVTLEARRRADRQLRMVSLGRGDGALITWALEDGALPRSWAVYPAAVARALADAGHDVGGLDLLVRSDLPTGAGLSSSAALECAVGLAFADRFGVVLAPMALATIARAAENRYVGVPCGIMDQAASVCGEVGHALLLDTRSLAIRQLPLALADAGLCLVVIDTRVERALIASEYAARRDAFPEAARRLGVASLRDAAEAGLGLELLGEDTALLRAARHVLSEHTRTLAAAALLERGALEELGPLLDASHRSLRDDLQVSCPELDLAVAAARDAGALGARMTGAGFGGSAIALCAAESADALGDAVVAAFAAAGYRTPGILRVTPAAGARRIA